MAGVKGTVFAVCEAVLRFLDFDGAEWAGRRGSSAPGWALSDSVTASTAARSAARALEEVDVGVDVDVDVDGAAVL